VSFYTLYFQCFNSKEIKFLVKYSHTHTRFKLIWFRFESTWRYCSYFSK